MLKKTARAVCENSYIIQRVGDMQGAMLLSRQAVFRMLYIKEPSAKHCCSEEAWINSCVLSVCVLP